MALPPGGFLALGFILAGKKILDRRLATRLRKETFLSTGEPLVGQL